MSKKLIALLMAAMMLLSMAAACGNQPTEPTEPTPAPSTDPAPAPAPTTPADPTPAEPVKDEKYGGDLIFVNNNVSNTMDPHHSNGVFNNTMWMNHVFETVIAHDDGGAIYPLICDYELSDDGLTLKLTLRDYCFSNGKKVTTDDIIASFERTARVDASFAANYWDYMTDTKVEGNTITYTFSKLIPTLLWQLSSLQGPYIIPKEICDKLGDDANTNVADAIGTGPYVLKEYTPDVQIVVERNEYYVPTMNDCTGPAAPRMAYSDTITFAINTDETSRTAGMIAGDYHIGSIMASMRDYADQIGLKLALLENQWTHGILFNLSENNADSPIQDVNVRKAIRATLDCEELMIAVVQIEDPERYILDPNPVVAANTAYYNTILMDTEWNIADKELAKQYLAQSNYNGEEIVWLASAGSAYYRIANLAVPALQEIGLNVKLEVCDSGAYGTLRRDPTSDYDIGAFETQKQIPNPIMQRALVLCQDFGWWQSDKKDELIDIMNNTVSGSAESVQAYKEFCQLLTEEVPWIGFGHNRSAWFTQPDVVLNYQGMEQYYWNTYFEK